MCGYSLGGGGGSICRDAAIYIIFCICIVIRKFLCKKISYFFLSLLTLKVDIEFTMYTEFWYSITCIFMNKHSIHIVLLISDKTDSE